MSDRHDPPIGVAVLGSTGSVGTQALDVIRQHPDLFNVVALAAGSNLDALEAQVREFQPAIASASAIDKLSVGSTVRLTAGDEGLRECATYPGVDVVLVATSGVASIKAIIAAAAMGRTVALANKEALVCGADLLLPVVRQSGAKLHPVDSEHSAIWQCMGSLSRPDVDRITLTASGGPFRSYSREQLDNVSVADALNHPTWSMGKKITIDSATLVNKGLEAIEAHHLFGLTFEQINVVVHPESVVHSLVEFADGSSLAQMSYPDMRLPIQYALTHPVHAKREFRTLNLAELGQLTFLEPNRDLFPALDVCFAAGRLGTAACIALCEADDLCVEAFLVGRIQFREIASVLERAVHLMPVQPIQTINDLHDAMAEAKSIGKQALSEVTSRH